MDSYRPQNDGGGAMTVFGFGRDDNSNPRDQMSAQDNVFTFGLADGGADFGAASSLISGVYRNAVVTIGNAQKFA